VDAEDRLLRELACAVEEDEQIAPSLCHAVYLEHLSGPLADALVSHLEEALRRGDAPGPLLAAYWRIVDHSLAQAAAALPASDVAQALDALRRDVEPDGPPALGVLARAHAWRRECAAEGPG
jgi:hypothetical protein